MQYANTEFMTCRWFAVSMQLLNETTGLLKSNWYDFHYKPT
ncbi:hypothetical protein BN4901_2559 [Citrobacter europaeus]|uniref:Uncharacterized protein n=1 Tax=Citrobacter europaeus TaxID=1914243 RepID=A0ABY0JQ51_9ENTR|nr:hypothetical protein BN4901_2559 [Citrobacter europaeus]